MEAIIKIVVAQWTIAVRTREAGVQSLTILLFGPVVVFWLLFLIIIIAIVIMVITNVLAVAVCTAV